MGIFQAFWFYSSTWENNVWRSTCFYDMIKIMIVALFYLWKLINSSNKLLSHHIYDHNYCVYDHVLIDDQLCKRCLMNITFVEKEMLPIAKYMVCEVWTHDLHIYAVTLAPLDHGVSYQVAMIGPKIYLLHVPYALSE